MASARFGQKGPTGLAGYWNNEEATTEALHGEWYNTGDLGEILDNGKLMITGRKKDLIVTAGGIVSPGPMEDILRTPVSFAGHGRRRW